VSSNILDIKLPSRTERPTEPPLERIVTIDRDLLMTRGLHASAENLGRQREEYRKIRREIIDAMRVPRAGLSPQNRGIVVLTSALPGDGKTYTALNLALSIANQGSHQVILVDGDTIKQSITEALELGGSPGLIEALSSAELDAKPMLLRTSVPHLQILPAGNRSDDSAELFSNERLTPVFASLQDSKHNAIIVVDTPPILLSSETQELTDIAEQVLLVVRAGVSLQDSAKEAAARIRESIPVGVVLNGWEPTIVSERRAYYAYETYAAYKKDK